MHRLSRTGARPLRRRLPPQSARHLWQWLVLACCLWLGGTPALAQTRPAAATASAAASAVDTLGEDNAPLPSVDELRKQLDAIPAKLG